MTTLELAQLLSRFDPATGALEVGDPLVYAVSSFEPGDGEGDLHYGLGVVQPGTVGQEFFMSAATCTPGDPPANCTSGSRGAA